MSVISVTAIGHVAGGRAEVRDDHWGDVEATIVLDRRFPADALAGLGDFSHVEVVYCFDRVEQDQIHTGARRPRGRADWPLVGIFAQRGKARPNRIGVSRAELLSVDGHRVRVRGLDAVDGTPVLDLKPWMDEFGPRGVTRQPAWATELMVDYYSPQSPDDARTGPR